MRGVWLPTSRFFIISGRVSHLKYTLRGSILLCAYIGSLFFMVASLLIDDDIERAVVPTVDMHVRSTLEVEANRGFIL